MSIKLCLTSRLVCMLFQNADTKEDRCFLQMPEIGLTCIFLKIFLKFILKISINNEHQIVTRKLCCHSKL